MPTTGMGGGKAVAIDGRPSGRLHRCVTLVVTLQYRRAMYGRVYACIDLKQQTDVRTTPAMTQSNWIHVAGGGGKQASKSSIEDL